MDKHEHEQLLRAFIAVAHDGHGFVFLGGRPGTSLVTIDWCSDPIAIMARQSPDHENTCDLIDCVPAPAEVALVLNLSFAGLHSHDQWLHDPNRELTRLFRATREAHIKGMLFGHHLKQMEDIADDLADDIRLIKAFRRRLCRLI